MKELKRHWLYYSISFALAFLVPVILYWSGVASFPFYVVLLSVLGVAMLVGRAIAIWYEMVTHRSEYTNEVDYPDPTIINTIGMKYRDE